MKIYISGRITGNDNYKNEFMYGAEIIKGLHAEPVNPAEAPEGGEYKWYIDNGLDLLKKCDAILMLPGWEKSAGARLEWQYATTVKMPVLKLKLVNGRAEF